MKKKNRKRRRGANKRKRLSFGNYIVEELKLKLGGRRWIFMNLQ